MKLFVPPNGHANLITFPLRFGVSIPKDQIRNVALLDEEFDEEGTENQNKRERDGGRKHYLGKIFFESSDQAIKIEEEVRAVLEMPVRQDQYPKLITVLMKEHTAGDNTVTKHLEGMHRDGKVTTQDVATIFHKAYTEGRLRNSNDVEAVYQQEIAAKAQVDSAEPGLQGNPSTVTQGIDGTTDDDGELMAPMRRKAMDIPGVQYKYAMADAYIWGVEISDDMICFKYLDEEGFEQSIHSFKLSKRPYLAGLHDYALNYLKERSEKRAKFAICVSEKCYGFLAESVTAISLQMKRAGKA